MAFVVAAGVDMQNISSKHYVDLADERISKILPI